MESNKKVTAINSLNKYLLFSLFVALTAFGVALSLKADIGVGAIDALCLSISDLVSVKVGTITIIINSFLLLGQIIILKKDFHIRNLLQIPLNLFVGYITNLFFYDVLSLINFDQYFFNLFCLLISFFILSVTVSAIMALDVVTFSLEGLCMAISEKYNLSFGKIRFSADIIFLIISILFSLIFKTGFYLREGTIIGALCLGPLIGFFTPRFQSLFKKWNIV